MKAISLLQPWAYLCVIGAKQFETRSWGTKYRGPLLIHASVNSRMAKELYQETPFNNFIKNWTDLPYGAVVGKVYLANVYYTQVLVNSLSEQEKAFGDYEYGRYA